MKMIETIKGQYEEMQARNGSSVLTPLEQNAFEAFNKLGVPTVRNEEWKYTRISSVFNKDYQLVTERQTPALSPADIDGLRLPGHEVANELVFVNGQYAPALSNIRSGALVVQSMEEASTNAYAAIVKKHLGDSSRYAKDGIHALNTAFIQGGVFIHINEGQITEHPLYIYNVTDARTANILSQPRSLVYVGTHAQVKIVETYITLGASESFTNQVMEIVMEENCVVEYYKIQNDIAQANQVSTTHFRQLGRSVVNAVTVSLNGGIVRNNLNVALEAPYGEAHFYGLYFLKGRTHVDNHTVVDNIQPNCLSNELYKGIIDDQATAVFNGKIFVESQAQKTNAFQSNKNILLSDDASVNTKPQLEIFADDVKCSHGCTVGQLDEEALFYLQSRGIAESTARSLLVNAFAADILNFVKLEPIRQHVRLLILERLGIEPVSSES
jgi:Fe-S cluster assembly protein SufD